MLSLYNLVFQKNKVVTITLNQKLFFFYKKVLKLKILNKIENYLYVLLSDYKAFHKINKKIYNL